ncbi:MAG: protein-glutamate O-methyltransferase CheR [Gammaproteobacteria bacterium]|nr:protein-glutamate O-methyltransferase CheR [Gammaproteobacteria bacterium]
MHANKEFKMTDADYSFISKTVYDECGIVLSHQKKDMVYSRLARRIRALNLSDFATYLVYLQDNKDQEFADFINAITTNLTYFFREPHHFDFLKNTIVPQMKQNHRLDKRVRIWSAGCSTGMEPYSIAMSTIKSFPKDWDFKILATDLDTNVLSTAKAGIYQGDSVAGIDNELLQTYFLHDAQGERYKAKDNLKKLITFKQLNLLEPWPMKGPFDVIFCRNVVIYFDLVTKNKLFERYAQMLRPDGYLILGHSETLSRDVSAFKALGGTIYQKV